MRGNTVGSTNTNFCKAFSNAKDAYVLGLWCADGYHRTSSIGITNINQELIERFKDFFLRYFSLERLRLKIYEPIAHSEHTESKIQTKRFKSAKAKHSAYQLYVNSRPLLREFRWLREHIDNLKQPAMMWAYMAGRFDGDGSIDKQLDLDCRIVYSNRKEAQTDYELLQRAGLKQTKIYCYKKARTFCLYISRFETRQFLEKIYPYSVRMQKLVFVPRRDFNLYKVQG